MTDIKDIKDIEKIKKDSRILSFILKKSERLSSALYLLTGLMSETEPLRSELRKKSVQILSDIHAAESKRYLDRVESLAAILREIDGTKALLAVAESAQLLAETNTSLVSRELGVLRAALEMWGDLKRHDAGFTLSPEFFLGDVPTPSIIPPRPREPEISISAKPAFPGASEVSANQGPQVGSAERREAIISYLRSNPESTLKDVWEGSRLGRDLSEKTVQRELVALVLEGRVSRSGERRWSRYSLPL